LHTDSNCYWLKPVAGEPRQRRYTDEKAAKNWDFLFSIVDTSTYGGTVANFSFWGLVIAICTILVWLGFFLGRCCCSCGWDSWSCGFCAPEPRREGYDIFYEVRVPIYIFNFIR